MLSSLNSTTYEYEYLMSKTAPISSVNRMKNNEKQGHYESNSIASISHISNDSPQT